MGHSPKNVLPTPRWGSDTSLQAHVLVAAAFDSYRLLISRSCISLNTHTRSCKRTHHSRIRNSDLRLIPDLFEWFLTAGFEMKQEVSAVVIGQLPLRSPARTDGQTGNLLCFLSVSHLITILTTPTFGCSFDICPDIMEVVLHCVLLKSPESRSVAELIAQCWSLFG